MPRPTRSTTQAEFARACPRPASRARGIEVGHIFYFGTKYSKPMNAVVAGPDGEQVAGRDGLLRHRRLAPGRRASSRRATTRPASSGRRASRRSRSGCQSARRRRANASPRRDDLYAKLNRAGIEVLYDDRDELAGAKFAAMDLIGLPWQVVIGPRGLAAGVVEAKRAQQPASAQRACAPDAALDAGSAGSRAMIFGTLRAHGGVPLSAGAPPGRLHLRHRHLLAARHHARRRHADHRHVGDERLPRRAARPHPRLQRPSRVVCDARRRSPNFDELTAADQGRARASSRSMPLVEGQVLAPAPTAARPAPWCAACAPSDLKSEALDRQPRRARGARKPSPTTRCWSAASSPSASASSPATPITLISPKARRRRSAPCRAIKAYHGRRHLRGRHVRIRQQHRLHAAAGGAALLSEARRGDQPARSSSTIPTAPAPSATRSRRSSATAPSSIDWQQQQSRFFGAVEIERNVMFLILTLIILVAAFNIISSMIMLVKDKGARHRHPAHHGGDARHDPAHLHPERRQHRRRRHARRLRARHRLRHPYRADPPVPAARAACDAVQRRRSISSRRSRRRSILPRSRPCWRWRSACRSWRRSIPPGAPRVSIRSRRCVMSERRGTGAALELRGVVRTYKQAGVMLPVLRGASLALRRARSSRWSARPAPASRRCCISPACSSAPMAARCCSAGAIAAACPTASAPRSAAVSSASSISSTICCRNSRRSRTSCCRR